MTEPTEKLETIEICDVCVAGGSPAGITAAVRAAREGGKVILVSANRHLGGVLSNGLSCWDTMYDGYRAPIQEEWLEKMRTHYRETYGEDSENYRISQSGPFGGGRFKGAYTWEPHIAERMFEELVASESGIRVVREYLPDAVERAGREIRSVFFRSLAGGDPMRVSAQVFIDATYESDVAALAGVPYRVGREARGEYNEIYAGKIWVKRSGNEANFSHGSDEALQWPRAARRGDLNLRPWWGTTQEIFSESTGEGDRAVQAANFRVCLSSDPDNQIPVEPPDGYDRREFLPIVEGDPEAGALYPHPIKSGLLNYPITAFPGVIPIPGSKCDWNAAAIPGGVDDFPDGNWETRQAIIKWHRDFALGLLFFLQHDDAVPEKIRGEALSWALPVDEFADNGHFPHEFYLREGRRIIGRYVMRESDACIGTALDRAPVHADAVAIAEWLMDSHDCTPERLHGAEGDGFTSLSEYTRPSQIPYRSFLPNDIDNLIMGLAVSATHVAWGTVRVEPCCMHIAETAGHAAALALASGVAPGDIEVEALQRRLVENRVMLTFFNEFDMATDASWVSAIQFLGTKGFFSSFNAKPDDPLTKAVGEIWARAFGSLMDGSHDAANCARQVAEAEKGEQITITADRFRALLQRELDCRDTEFAVNLSAELSGDRRTGSDGMVLTRAEASLLVYRLLAISSATQSEDRLLQADS